MEERTRTDAFRNCLRVCLVACMVSRITVSYILDEGKQDEEAVFLKRRVFCWLDERMKVEFKFVFGLLNLRLHKRVYYH